MISFSARRDESPSGETVLASYLAVGDRGSIALLDAAGTVVSTGAFSKVGTIRLNVPKQYRLLPMIAQITVHRGETKAVSSVDVPPNAAPAPRPSPTPSAHPPASAEAPGEAITPIASAASGNAAGLVAVGFLSCFDGGGPRSRRTYPAARAPPWPRSSRGHRGWPVRVLT